MAGGSCANLLIGRVSSVAASEAGYDFFYAPQLLEFGYILLTVKPDRATSFKEAKETLFFRHNHFEGATPISMISMALTWMISMK